MPKLRMYMLAVCVLAMPGMAVADMITETFTFPTVGGYTFPTSVAGSDLTLFNPALGTLTAATIDLNATATWSGGSSTAFNTAVYTMDVAGIFETVMASSTGPGSDTGSATSGVPSGELSSLIGPGAATTSVLIIDASSPGGGSISSTFATESVVYTYTPAVPEPEMLPVLGGILAVGVFWRRRRAAS
jgi:hypothetical protein